MKKIGIALFAAAALVAVPFQAQSQTTVGPVLAYHGGADLGVGAYVSVPVPSIHENFAINGSFGYFFPDGGGDFDGGSVDVAYWELNADGVMRFPLEGNDAIMPFAMAGLNIANWSVDADVDGLPGFNYGVDGTEIGLNLGGGIAFTNVGSLRPSVGAKIELNGGDDFVIFGALGFPLGG